MASAPSLISFDEYMQTSYSPDCDYLDGVIEERNVGQGKHAFVQLRLGMKLTELARPKSLIVTVEHRVRVSANRVRIPDVCVTQRLEEVVTEPPLLCVEILSPDDRWERVNARVRDYQGMGVPCIWVIDPYARRAWIFDAEQPPLEVPDGRLTANALGIEVALADLLPPD